MFLLTNFDKKELRHMEACVDLCGLKDDIKFEATAYDAFGRVVPGYYAIYVINNPYNKRYELSDAVKRGDKEAEPYIELDKKVGEFFNIQGRVQEKLYQELLKAGFDIPEYNKYCLYLGMSKEDLLKLCCDKKE